MSQSWIMKANASNQKRGALATNPLKWSLALAPIVVACSFFEPTVDEYSATFGSGGSRPDAGAGSGGVLTAGAGDGGSANRGMTTDQGGQAGKLAAGDAGTGGMSGAAGAEPEQPDAPAVLGVLATTDDVTLQRPVTWGLPTFAAVTNYGLDEASVQTQPELPLYQPYSSSDPGWWDNLVAEQTQASLTTIAFPTTGTYTTDASDLTGPGGMNPRQLSAWTAALGRANAAALFQALCLVDTSRLPEIANKLHGKPPGTVMDLSVTADWVDVFWSRAIKPWFDTIPKSYWYQYNGKPVIELGGLPAASYTNTTGNLGGLLSAISNSFTTAYSAEPLFVLDASWLAAEASLGNNATVAGVNPWLEPQTSASYGFSTARDNFLGGTIVPGFNSGSLSIPRSTTDSYNNQVDTLVTGFTQTILRYANNGNLTLLQGFTDAAQSAGFYRGTAATWVYPNHYLNVVRSYVDLRTATLRLEAEGCDHFQDTTTGNSGAAFRRGGDLDIRALSSSGWAVTNTAPGEWLEFSGVNFSVGSYEFIAQYSTTRGAAADTVSKRIELVLDGAKQTPVIVQNTANVDSFAGVVLGTLLMTHGQHTVRVRFLDGFVDLDWLFVKKISPVLSLKTQTGMYTSSPAGGGSTTINAAAPAASLFEQYTFDDLNGGALVDGDVVNIQTYNGFFLSAAGSTVSAATRTPGSSEAFVVHTTSAGPVMAGSTIAIQTPDLNHYLTTVSPSLVDASGTSVGAAQTFTVGVY